MIKLGVIGVGSMGKNHLRVALELSKYYELVGIYDASAETAEKMATMYNVKVFSNLDDLIKEVDACVVAAPSSLHKEIGMKLGKAKKHALIEKPICLNKKEAEELESTFKNSVLMIGHIERYNPVIMELSKILKKEEIIGIEARRCSPYDPRIFDASVVMDLMIHDIDIIINELCHNKIQKINVLGNNMLSPKKLDYVQSILKFDNNIVCSILASRSTEEKIREIDIHTKSKFITADLLQKKLILNTRTNIKMSDDQVYKQDSLQETIILPFIEPLKEEHMEFIKSINENRLPKTNGESSIRSLELAEKIEKMAEEQNG